MANGVKQLLEEYNHEEDKDGSEYRRISRVALLKILSEVENKSIDWKIWGMFSIPIIMIVLDKVLVKVLG